MSEREGEAHSPTGLERLARLLAVTKENASAEISKLGSQVEALQVERRTLEESLESCRDQLGDANSLVEQLRLENTRKWRVEERDDWRALLDSMQSDRTALQHENDRLEAELTRCIAALLSIFPSVSSSSRKEASPAKGATVEGKDTVGGVEKKAEAVDGAPDDRDDHPPELTHRCTSISSGSGGRSVNNRAIAEVDLEWLGSVAEEFNVVVEGVPDAGGDESGGAGVGGKGIGVSAGGAGGGHRASPSGADVASECLRLRLELDALSHASNTERVALESQVFEQEQELQRLRLEVSRSRRKSGGKGEVREEGGGAAPEQRGGVSLAGVFRWWRQDGRAQAVPDRRRGGRGASAGGTVTGAVTVV